MDWNLCEDRDGMWSTSDRCEEAIDPASPTAPAFAAEDVEDIYVKWYEKWESFLIYLDTMIQTWWEGDAFAAAEGRCVLKGWWDDIPIHSDFCDQSNIHLQSEHLTWVFSSQLLMWKWNLDGLAFFIIRLYSNTPWFSYITSELRSEKRNRWPESRLDTFCENGNHKKRK